MVIDLILNSKYLGDCFDFIATALCDDLKPQEYCAVIGGDFRAL
jgi:hypothetical protein